MRKQQLPEPTESGESIFLGINVVLSLILLIVIIIGAHLNKKSNDSMTGRLNIIENKVWELKKELTDRKIVGEYFDGERWCNLKRGTYNNDDYGGFTCIYPPTEEYNYWVFDYTIVANQRIVWYESPNADFTKKEEDRRAKAKRSIEKKFSKNNCISQAVSK